MSSYWKNGKEIRISGIYDKGKVGQTVIYSSYVSYGDNPDPEKYPLSQYLVPTIFTIVDKVDGNGGYYILKDPNGKLIKLQDHSGRACSPYLYDPQTWLTWHHARVTEELSKKVDKIKQLENDKALLMDILIKQGIRIVSKEQAEKLGI